MLTIFTIKHSLHFKNIYIFIVTFNVSRTYLEIIDTGYMPYVSPLFNEANCIL